MAGWGGGKAIDMTMDVVAWAIVVGGAVLTLLVAMVLARRPHPGDLSEQEGRPKRQGRHVVDRPAGPGAEPMGPDDRPNDRSDQPGHPGQTGQTGGRPFDDRTRPAPGPLPRRRPGG